MSAVAGEAGRFGIPQIMTPREIKRAKIEAVYFGGAAYRTNRYPRDTWHGALDRKWWNDAVDRFADVESPDPYDQAFLAGVDLRTGRPVPPYAAVPPKADERFAPRKPDAWPRW